MEGFNLWTWGGHRPLALTWASLFFLHFLDWLALRIEKAREFLSDVHPLLQTEQVGEGRVRLDVHDVK